MTTWDHDGTSQHGRNDQHLFPLRAKRAIGHILNVGVVLRSTAPLRVVAAGGRVCGACAMENMVHETLHKRAVVGVKESGCGRSAIPAGCNFPKLGNLPILILTFMAAVACAERRLTTSAAGSKTA